MNSIIANIIKNILNFFSNIADYILNLPDFFRNIITKSKLFLYDQVIKFDNLSEANIELGKYHLHNGHVTDAIIRFRISKMLFDKNNHEIDYWLGWCYFLKPDYILATQHLDMGKDFDKEGLGNFIKDPNSVAEVPNSIWHMLRGLTISQGTKKYYSHDFYNKPIELPLEFIEFFLHIIEEMPTGAKILDFGCENGLVGSYLDYKIDAKYYITGVDEHQIYMDYIKDIRGERGFVYDKTLLLPLSNINDIFGKEKYDAIFSFDSLSFVKNFSRYFEAFYKSLNRNGHFVMLLPSSNRTMWDHKRRAFTYDSNDLSEQLSLAKFNIIDIKEWSLGGRNSYTAFICSKTQE